MAEIQPLVAGNWKMNGTQESLGEIRAMCERAARIGARPHLMICPPATLISRVKGLVAASPIQVGAQDCHTAESGAHTGDISAEMLKDAGASAVIVGHSERRGDHGESDALVRAKALAAHRAGLIAIICIGETEGQRRYELTLPVLGRQVRASVPESATAANTIIAYEPVWAIGTGLTPTTDDVAEAHAFIRQTLAEHLGEEAAGGMRILYGGSVKPANAAELMSVANVNGALVGGASLKAEDFFGIVAAYGSA